MKKIFFTLAIICFLSPQLFSQAFITTWDTNGDNYITIPGYGTNYGISWYEVANPSHSGNQLGTNTVSVNFGSPGIYSVSISGGSPAFNRINFSSITSQPHKLIKVNSWGNIVWSNMDSMFMNCYKLDSLPTAAPNLSNVTSMALMFYECTKFNSNINNWDVSNVTNMNLMFYSATSFNQPLNNWNVSNVTTMQSMFYSATSFNQPLNNWNVSNVTKMISMFYFATSFNQPLNNWNVSNVTNMLSMFGSAMSFNQPLNNWNVSNVTTMESMFGSAISFNQPLNNWNVSNVKYMHTMFGGATSFNQPLNNWNVSNVKYMTFMFYGAKSFNQPLDNWNVNKVISMEAMFYKAKCFNQPLNNWDVSNVQSMRLMFAETDSFNQPLNNWNVGNVNSMSLMFSGAKSFNQPLNNWNVNKVEDMSKMFANTKLFNQPLNNWNTNSLKNLGDIFDSNYVFNQNIGNWNITNIPQNSTYYLGIGHSGIDQNNYDSILIGWSKQNVQSNVRMYATDLKYCSAGIARDSLILKKHWIILGDNVANASCILPVNLLSFNAAYVENRVNLQWQTATENNTSHFNIQYSINGKDFETIGTKAANNKPSNYSFIHNLNTSNTYSNALFYRLQIVDKDGSIAYSEIKLVNIKPSTTITIYPNPSNNLINLVGNSIQQITITNIAGKELLVKTFNNSQKETIDISQLSNGVYFVSTITNNNKTVQKIVKQ